MKIQSPRKFLSRLVLRRRVRALNLALSACLFLGATAGALSAADGTWTFDGNAGWSDPTNWSGGVIADGANSTASFAYGITANRVVTLDTPRTIGNLYFDDTGTGATVDATGDSVWTLTGTAANPLTFSTTSGTSTITANSQVGYGNEFSISAVLAGTNNLVFNSTQTLNSSSQRYLQVTNAGNTYTGTTTLSNGFLDVGANSILAAGSPLGISNTAIIVGNANTVVNTAGGGAPTTGLQIFATGAATANYSINRDIDSSTTADVAGRTDIRFYNNSVGANGTMTVSSNWALSATGTNGHTYGLDAQQPGQTINFTGNITGTTNSGVFRINDYGQGNGTIRLAGMNTFAGQVVVEEGTLVIGNNAPAAGAGSLGSNAAFQIASNGVTSVTSANSNATLTAVTDGGYTVGKNVNVTGTNFTPGGGVLVQNAFSWTLGGTSATASSFTGAINSQNVAFSRTLNLTQSAGGTTTFSGIVGPNADATNVTVVEKTGAGTVVLSNANTYDGGTRITGGTLLVNGTGVTGTSSGTGIGSVSVGVVSLAQSGAGVSSTTAGATAVRTTRQLDGISNTVAANLQVGQTVTGTGIPAGSIVQAVGFNASGTASIVISNVVTIPIAGLTISDLAFGALTTTGTLGGSGTINPLAGALVTVNAGSTLAPGGAVGTPGILSIIATQTTTPTGTGAASLNLLAGSNLAIKLNGSVVGTGYDQVNVTGTVALGGGTLTLTLSGLTPTPGQKFVIVNNDGSDTVFGTFAGLADGSTVTAGGQNFTINYNAVGGVDGIANDIVLTAAVPEPGTWAGLVIGFGALGLVLRRRARTA